MMIHQAGVKKKLIAQMPKKIPNVERKKIFSEKTELNLACKLNCSLRKITPRAYTNIVSQNFVFCKNMKIELALIQKIGTNKKVNPSIR